MSNTVDSLNSALYSVKDKLQRFAQEGKFNKTDLEPVFGSNTDREAINAISQKLLEGNFDWLPKIEVKPANEIERVRGVYVDSLDIIYLSDRFLESVDQGQIETILLKEIGHALDPRVNTVDTPGDEGDFFSQMVLGFHLNQTVIENPDAENEPIESVIDGIPTTAEASRLVVTTNLDVVNNADGVISLREALQSSRNDDKITFASNLKGQTITLQGSELLIDKSVTIDGDIDGDKTSDITINGNNRSRIFTVDNNNFFNYAEVELKGLNLVNGRSDRSGGGIYNLENLSITDSSISGSLATTYGGALASFNGKVTIENSIITGNRANYSGGGIVNRAGNLDINHSTISDNSAAIVAGGALNYNDNLFVVQTTVNITNSSISNNTARRNAGGIMNYAGKFKIDDSTISGNSVDQEAGGIDNFDGLLDITNSTISGNTARDNGGGISNDYFAVTNIENSTIAENSARNGGGIINDIRATTNITSSIISRNWSNDIDGSTRGLFSRGNNVIGTGPGLERFNQPGDMINADPGLETLRNNGGRTLTHALRPNSPAIDGGSNPNNLRTDQRGETRVVGAAIDIGAFEYNPPVNNPSTPSDEASTINNQVSLTVNPRSVSEDGDRNIQYVFSREGDLSQPLLVGFEVGGNAIYNQDYTQTGATGFNRSQGTINFRRNQSTVTLTIDPISDQDIESDEEIQLTLSNGRGYDVITNQPLTAVIENSNFNPPNNQVSLTVNPISVSEDGDRNIQYVFSREGDLSQRLSVGFEVGGNAIYNQDYTQTGANDFNRSQGTINFRRNQSTVTLTIDPISDQDIESDEEIQLTLSNGRGYDVITNQPLTAVIENSNFNPPNNQVSLTVNPISVSEDGDRNIQYVFSREGDLSQRLSVRFEVGGNAIYNRDYTQTGATGFNRSEGTINFRRNQSIATVTIDPKADTNVESDEEIQLKLLNSQGYDVITNQPLTAVIENDDKPVISINNLIVIEKDSGLTQADFTVILSDPIQEEVNIRYTTRDSYTATESEDFLPTSGVLTIPPGQTQGKISVFVRGDTKIEDDEEFNVRLEDSDNAVYDRRNSIVKIINDDDLGNGPYRWWLERYFESGGSVNVFPVGFGSNTDGIEEFMLLENSLEDIAFDQGLGSSSNYSVTTNLESSVGDELSSVTDIIPSVI